MKLFRIYITLLALFSIAGCGKADFNDLVHDVPSGKDFLFPESINLVLGKDTLTAINGKDSCFVQIIDGDDIVEVATQYVIGDKVFYGGITSNLMIHPLSTGVAHCRFYNNRYELDTTIRIIVNDSTTSGGESNTGYTITFSSNQYSIDSVIEIVVTGPKPMGSRNLDAFLLYSYGSNVTYDNTINAYVRKEEIRLKYVGTAYYKFFNEEWDTTICIDILPQYNTFTEPPLDFDDTRDSVILKMGTPDNENVSDGILSYNLMGSVYPYTLEVRMREDAGTIKDYDVYFDDANVKEELRHFVEERYYQHYSDHNGYHLYVRGYNQTIPSPYVEGNKVLVENFMHGKISYKNPVRSWEW